MFVYGLSVAHFPFQVYGFPSGLDIANVRLSLVEARPRPDILEENHVFLGSGLD